MTASPRMTLPRGPGVTVVTGGLGEIGTAVARRLLDDPGARVVLTDLASTCDLEASFAAAKDRVRYVSADVTSQASIERAAAEALSAFGRLDAWVNSAGITIRGPSVSYSEKDWDQVLAVNLKGTFLGCQAAARVMLPAKAGSIVNIASTAAHTGFRGRAAYCASKAGVVNLTRALAAEWSPDGVRLNSVSPAHANTRMARDAIANGFVDGEALLRRIPLGRLVEPSEIADAVVWLCSDASGFVTGTDLAVDGGFQALGLY